MSLGELSAKPEMGRCIHFAESRTTAVPMGDGGFLLSGGQRDPGSHPAPQEKGWFVLGKKKQNLNRARNMDVDDWRDRQVRKRLQARLDMENRAFKREHADETDDDLIEYVRKKAVALRRMPHPLEIPGGLYLHRRLGDWDALARSLGLAPVGAGRGNKLYHQLLKTEEEQFFRERRARKAAKRRKKEPKDPLKAAFQPEAKKTGSHSENE